MLILIKEDMYPITKELAEKGFNSIEVEFSGCGDEYCNEESFFVFEVAEDRLDEFAICMLRRGHIITHEKYEMIKIGYDNITSHRRIHPLATRKYVERMVSHIEETDVYVDGRLYLEKRSKPTMNWK